ncbi:acyl carrier protein [Streptomyces sp. M10]|uniref:acyl carrier protein n=1 Tax=Streptomyces sp. M10 TaxID=412968 RepID=UPI000645E549|nr:acyl carrier protein [Streptomyces sp. M10]
MSSDLQPFAPSVPPAPPADPLAEVVAVLAGVLMLDPEKIDPRRSFRFLGLGSLQAVEFVAGVNARCGTRVKAPALFDHESPAAFARHIADEMRPERAASLPGADAGAPSRGLTALVPPPAGRRAGGEILGVLREELARLVRCDPWEIDAHAPFALMGLGSVLATEFVATVNHIYGTGETASVLGTHPNLAALAAHVATLTAEPAPMDMEVLLDAVRDNLLTIDQALALLPRRS